MFYFFILNVYLEEPDVFPNYLRVQIQIGKIFNSLILLKTHILSKKDSFTTYFLNFSSYFSISHSRHIFSNFIKVEKKNSVRVVTELRPCLLLILSFIEFYLIKFSTFISWKLKKSFQ